MQRVVAPAKGAHRRTREELRSTLVAAGRDLLMEEGLAVGGAGLTFKRAFERLEATRGVHLTNASVIRRVWENQADFRADVLVEAAQAADSSGEAGATLDALFPLVATFDLTTPEGRMRALQDLARIGGEVSIRSRLATPEWSVWMGAWVLSLTGSDTEERRRVKNALLEGLEEVSDLWDQIYGVMSASLGFRMRPGLTMRQFTVSSATLVEGCALEQGDDGEVAMVSRPTGPGGALEEWTIFGIGLSALSRAYFEIDPDWIPPEPGA